jgi:hypothetical protein
MHASVNLVRLRTRTANETPNTLCVRICVLYARPWYLRKQVREDDDQRKHPYSLTKREGCVDRIQLHSELQRRLSLLLHLLLRLLLIHRCVTSASTVLEYRYYTRVLGVQSREHAA